MNGGRPATRMKDPAKLANTVNCEVPGSTKEPHRDCDMNKPSKVVTCIWRAGDLLLPLRATSSCHRCRSAAGWRDRQVLSGCKPKIIRRLSNVNLWVVQPRGQRLIKEVGRLVMVGLVS